MKIFNTLTGKKDEFASLEPGKVKMYVCGPTVHNFIHIGNIKPMIVFDTVRRYFEYKGYEVNYVSNFTDVDDKIIKRVVEEGVGAETIFRHYTKECRKDMTGMNAKPATTHLLTTQEICRILRMIQKPVDSDHVYRVEDGMVYFRAGSFKEYGKLSHKNLEDLQFGFRETKMTGEDGREDPSDFVLWKPKKGGEPYWEPPWYNECPGWRIECSVIPKKHLGEQIGIRAGGEGLIFPHHKNETTQSEAANDKEFTRYWMYNAFLNIDSRKMSKSLGNFFIVREINEKYNLQVLRFFILSTHYRSLLNFNAELVESPKNGLERILMAVGKLCDLETKTADGGMTGAEDGNVAEAKVLVEKYEAAMNDDFNTTDTIAAVSELVKLSNSTADVEGTKAYISYTKETIEKLRDILGVITEKKEEVLDGEVEALIEARQQAKKDENSAPVDKICRKPLDMGIVLKDTQEGVKRKRA